MASIAQASYDVNVLSCLKTISAMLPLLAHSPRPRIAVLSSVAAEIPAPTRSIYAANKAALSMFLRSLRIELEDVQIPDKRPVGISIVHPASIKTGLRGKALDAVQTEGRSGTVEKRPQSHEKSAMTAEYVAQQVKRAIDEEIDEMWLPKSYWWVAKVGMVLFPDLIAAKAKKKYNWIM